VNPRYADIDGVTCYASVNELPEVPDVSASCYWGRTWRWKRLKQAGQLGTRAAIVLAGGYAEIDVNRARKQAELLKATGKMRLLGPNTIGMVNVADGTALSASIALELDELPKAVRAVVSPERRDARLTAVARRGAWPRFFKTDRHRGHEARHRRVRRDRSTSSTMPDTRVIALYLESVRRPCPFSAKVAARRQASAASARWLFQGPANPKLGVAVGKRHSTRCAGRCRSECTTRCFARPGRYFGGVFFSTLSGLIDVSLALVASKPLVGSRLAIPTSTGGGGRSSPTHVVCTASSTPHPIPHGGPPAGGAPSAKRPPADRNPIDLTLANLRSETYRDTIAALIESPTYDALIVVVGFVGAGRSEAGRRAGAGGCSELS